jgi:anti-anti-sigma factor
MSSFDSSFGAILSTVYLNAGSRLDLANSLLLRRRLDRAIRRAAQSVVLVCTQVDVVDPVGVQMLVEATREARRQGRQLRIVNLSPELIELLVFCSGVDELELDLDARAAMDRLVPLS